MQRSIIPRGFEKTSHPIFRSFVPPIALPEVCEPCVEPPGPDADAETEGQSKRRAGEGAGAGAGTGAGTGAKVPDEAETGVVCPICLGDIVDHATLVLCRHHFCAKCLLAWYKVRVNCPVCKQSGSFFLNGCRHNALQPEMKLWTVDGAAEAGAGAGAGAVAKPSKEAVRVAILAHDKACGAVCARPAPRAEEGEARELPARKKVKLS
jgi:hypothetical protein